MGWFGSVFGDLATPVVEFIRGDQAVRFWLYFKQSRRELIGLPLKYCIHPALETEGFNKQAEINIIFLLSMA